MNTQKQQIKVIIGAGYGDEGKGNIAAGFSAKGTIGVMTNGGAQRGHRAVFQGRSHIFHHFFSGTLRGADTYFSERFLLNPMTYVKERRELLLLGIVPNVCIHPKCPVQLPYDMILNQAQSEAEGSRHTCGMGIWESVQRQMNGTMLCYSELRKMKPEEKIRYLQGMRDRTLEKLRSIPGAESWKMIAASDILLQNFLSDLQEMEHTSVMADYDQMKNYSNIVFENGQGLAISWSDESDAVYTTPSDTGLTYAKDIIEASFTDAQVEVCYVTRSYATRHGQGELEGERDLRDLRLNCHKETNLTNDFQGNFRYAPLNTEQMMDRIEKDYVKGAKNIYRRSLAVTHLDEREADSELRKAADLFDQSYWIGNEEGRL